MIESIQKSNHIVTNHVVNGQSNNTTFGLHGNGFFNGGLTTIRRKRTRKVPYNQIEGGLAHCTVFDKNNNRLISDESVLNGGIYQLLRCGEYVFLEAETTQNKFQSDSTCHELQGTGCGTSLVFGSENFRVFSRNHSWYLF